MAVEYEAKFIGVDPHEVRQRLASLGYSCHTPESMMIRKTFHFVEDNGREWFRIRKDVNGTTLTYKHKRADTIDGVEELEVEVNDFDTTVAILLKTGVQEVNTSENLREVWHKGTIEVCIDTWPGLRPYIEIEGPDGESVEQHATELGYHMQDALFGPVTVVYEAELGMSADAFLGYAHITFANPPMMSV